MSKVVIVEGLIGSALRRHVPTTIWDMKKTMPEAAFVQTWNSSPSTFVVRFRRSTGRFQR